jgi:hypothetical protein
MTFKGTFGQLFIRVYGLEIQPVMLVFSTHLCELCSLWFISPPPPPCVNKYTVFTRLRCVKTGMDYGVIGGEGADR